MCVSRYTVLAMYSKTKPAELWQNHLRQRFCCHQWKFLRIFKRVFYFSYNYCLLPVGIQGREPFRHLWTRHRMETSILTPITERMGKGKRRTKHNLMATGNLPPCDKFSSYVMSLVPGLSLCGWTMHFPPNKNVTNLIYAMVERVSPRKRHLYMA